MSKLSFASQEIQFRLFHKAKGINTKAFTYHLQIRHNYVILRFKINLEQDKKFTSLKNDFRDFVARTEYEVITVFSQV